MKHRVINFVISIIVQTKEKEQENIFYGILEDKRDQKGKLNILKNRD